MTEPEGSSLELVIVTGMSGAGRTTAAHALEDLGWYVVDNLPPALLPRLTDLGAGTAGEVSRIAAVVDVRSLTFFVDLQAALESLHATGIEARIVFLEAVDDVLVRRFESVRRPHPLQGEGRVLDGIERERELLRDLRADADLVVDTSALNVHQLAARLRAAFPPPASRDGTDGIGGGPKLQAIVMSFGYKYGLPVDADLVVDCRFLPNPHWVPELRALTGRDEPVSRYVMSRPGAGEFVDRFGEVLHVLNEGYQREGRRYVTLAVGCTGGKHRSVAMVEELARRLHGDGVRVNVVHRDLGRE